MKCFKMTIWSTLLSPYNQELSYSFCFLCVDVIFRSKGYLAFDLIAALQIRIRLLTYLQSFR